MQLKFTVHNPHGIPLVREVSLDGTPVTATVHGFEVELQALDSLSGTMKVRATGEAAKAAAELFKDGTIITATFTGEPAAVEEPAQAA